MVPFLIIATAIFATFLAVLAAIGFAAFRFAAKREGPGLGAPGGCMLAAVLLGAAFFGLIGFAIFAGIMVHRADRSDSPRTFRTSPSFQLESGDEEHDRRSEPEQSDRSPAPPPGVEKHDDVRQY